MTEQDVTRRIIIILTVLIFAVSAAGLSFGTEMGDPAPDFRIMTLDGNQVSSRALEGKPILLVFWNTWCPDCMRELPRINRLAEVYGPKGLAVLAVNTAMNDSEPKARSYWTKNGYVFPTAFDKYFDIGQAFAVRGVPTIFMIDSKGIVSYKQSKIPDDVEERLNQLTGPK